MKKKLMSLMLCAALAAGTSVFATEADDISVLVDDRTVYFDDQTPVIEDSRTLVPLRGVLEAMDAKVEWDEENRSVTINSYDNRTRLILTIDNPEIRKLNFITVTDTDIETVTSDVAPKIINDRTMIPLRVISENMDADVDWNSKDYIVDIKTKQYKKAVAALVSEGVDEETALEQSTVGMTLSADKSEVSEGDIVTVTVSLDNTDVISDCTISGGSVGVFYNSDNFDYVGYNTFVGGEEASVYLGADNPEFKNDSVKAVFLLDIESSFKPADGAFIQLQFRATNDKGGEFKLSNRITNVGKDTYIAAARNGRSISISEGYELRVDTAPVAVGTASADANQADDSADTTGNDDTAVDDKAE